MDLEEGKSGEIETGRLKNWTDKVQNYQVDECRAMDVEEGGRND